MQDRANLVHEVIAGRAIHRPRGGQTFACHQYLLHINRTAGPRTFGAQRTQNIQPFAQALAVGGRRIQPIDMVHTQPVYHPALIE